MYILLIYSIHFKKIQVKLLTHKLKLSIFTLLLENYSSGKGGIILSDDKKSIKELRVRFNKTQEEVAKDLGVSTRTYCAWEKSISNLGVSKVLALANYYKVTLDQIFLN